jgi:hypothetical protein
VKGRSSDAIQTGWKIGTANDRFPSLRMAARGRLVEKWSGIEGRLPDRRTDAKRSSEVADVGSAALRDRWQNGRGTCSERHCRPGRDGRERRHECLLFGHCGHSLISDSAIRKSASNVGSREKMNWRIRPLSCDQSLQREPSDVPITRSPQQWSCQQSRKGTSCRRVVKGDDR